MGVLASMVEMVLMVTELREVSEAPLEIRR